MQNSGITINCIWFFVLVTITQTYSQKSVIFDKIATQNYDQDWIKFNETGEITVYSKYTDCSDPAEGFNFEQLLFKVENKTGENLTVIWHWEYTYNHIPRAEESDDEIFTQVILRAGDSVSGECASGENNNLRLFVRDKVRVNTPQLTDFDMNNLSALK